MIQNKTQEKQMMSLADSIGDFIRYWGFRRIHGQIWTLLYLKNKALNPTQIAKDLNVSKSLISSALIELEEHGLIQPYIDPENTNRKTKLFKAEKDVLQIIQTVLKERELKIIENVKNNLSKMSTEDESIDLKRLQDLNIWTEAAHMSLKGLVDLADLSALDSF
jgi:DNA-binding transcriptional regulator GbsR (MarR family)